MIDTVGTKFRGGQNFLLTLGGFYNEREYSVADWLVLPAWWMPCECYLKGDYVNLK